MLLVDAADHAANEAVNEAVALVGALEAVVGAPLRGRAAVDLSAVDLVELPGAIERDIDEHDGEELVFNLADAGDIAVLHRGEEVGAEEKDDVVRLRQVLGGLRFPVLAGEDERALLPGEVTVLDGLQSRLGEREEALGVLMVLAGLESDQLDRCHVNLH